MIRPGGFWVYGPSAAGLGAIAALGQPPLFHWYATLAALAGLFWLFTGAKWAWQGFALLWLFGVGFFGVALRWIVEPFQVEAELFGWMAPFALVFMAGGLALFWGVAGAVAARALRGKVGALVLALGVAELARAYVLTGFPWAGFAQIWVDHGMAQILAWIGPHGLGLVTLLFAAVPVMAAGFARIGGIFVGVALVTLAALWQARLATPETTGPVVRIAQPNAPQREKWDPAHAPRFFQRLIEATEQGDVPDLIVWSETAIPQLLNYAGSTLERVHTAQRGAPLVLGMLREESGTYYNSMLVLDAAGEITEIYDKHHLVPFGEYIPLAPLVGRLGIRGLAQRIEGGFGRGEGPTLVDLGALGTALPLICYEAVFPHHAHIRGARPDMLLHLTNDAWFGTYAGPQQHLAQARMRAIEQGVPVIRAANTGISAMIDAHGQVTASLGLDQHGFFDAPLPMARPATLYAQTGDWLIGLVLLGAAALRMRKQFSRLPIDDTDQDQ